MYLYQFNISGHIHRGMFIELLHKSKELSKPTALAQLNKPQLQVGFTCPEILGRAGILSISRKIERPPLPIYHLPMANTSYLIRWGQSKYWQTHFGFCINVCYQIICMLERKLDLGRKLGHTKTELLGAKKHTLNWKLKNKNRHGESFNPSADTFCQQLKFSQEKM